MTYLSFYRYFHLFCIIMVLVIRINTYFFEKKIRIIGKINRAEMPGLNDPSCAYELFVGKYTTIYDKCFPLRKMKAKWFNLRKPWFTKGLAKSIRKKNKLYHSFLNSPNSSNENAYKSYKNKLTHSLRVAKRLYYAWKTNWKTKIKCQGHLESSKWNP